MSNYTNTKAVVAANVYTNNNNEVTAAMVKAAINEVIDTLIAGGYLYKGVATTSTNPGSPDANVFYLATAPGTYTNFGSLVVNDGEVCVLKYNGSWSKEVTGAATAAQVNQLRENINELDYTRSEYYEQSGIITKTGATTTSSNWTRYIIKNNGYSRIKVTAYTSTNYMAIAFYNSLEWGASSFMESASVVGRNYTQSYDVEVPVGCACFIVCNNTANRALPIIKLEGKGGLDSTINEITPLRTGNDLGVDSPLSALVFEDTKGISDSSGALFSDNLKIACNTALKVEEYAVGNRIYFSYKGTSTNKIFKAVAFYTSNNTFIMRFGYKDVDSVGVPFNATYFKIALGLANAGGTEIGGHASDYDLENAYIRKNLNLVINSRNYLEKLPKALGLENADEVIDGYTIYYSSGALTTSDGKKIYLFKNYGFNKVEARLGANSNTFAAIAFYNDEVPSASSYISGIASNNASADDYSAIVPTGCKLIAISANEALVVPSATIYTESVKSAFDKMDARYQEIKEKIGDKTDIVSLNDPLQTPHLLQQMKFTGGIKNPTSVNPLVLLHFSDIHGGNTETHYVINKTTLQRIIDFSSAYSDYIDDMICTGDECYQDITDRQNPSGGTNWWDAVAGTDKILPVVGNHDTYASGSTENGSAGKEATYAALFNHIDDADPSEHTEGNCYYYKDYSTSGIRLIVVDPYYGDTTEVEWFQQALADAKTQGLSVVVAAHPPFNSYTPLPVTFISLRFSGSFNQHVDMSAYIDAVEEFIADEGSFICWITGHVHGDVVGYYEHNGIKQLAIGAPSAKAPRSAGTSSETNNVDMRILGTKSQDSFNLISFETAYKTLTIKRIGSDYDVALRHRGVCTINYETMQVLYND